MRKPEDLTIIAVDDEPSVLFSIQKNIKDYFIQTFTESHEVLKLVQQTPCDILIVDQVMPVMTGIELLTEAKKFTGYKIGILISAYIEKELLEEMVNNKLIDYVLEKPFKLDDLRRMLGESVKSILKSEIQFEEKQALENKCRFFHTAGSISIISCNFSIKNLLQEATQMANSKAAVLLTGESGVGKELFAYWTHYHGKRGKGPFIKVNCSAIPEALFESELFGYEKGAFTGADKYKPGKFELANGGTLFLDEVGDLPLSQQAKLLRVLEDKELTRLGGTEAIKIDFRVISATNLNLSEMVKHKEFREDLFYRLNVLRLSIPALRERKDDIVLLSENLLMQIAGEEGGVEKKLDQEALLYLTDLSWPGNVRELKNMMHRLYFATTKTIIVRQDIENLQVHLKGLKENVFFEETMEFNTFKKQFESTYLRRQLDKFNQNLTQTARALGMAPSNLSRKLKFLGLTVPSPPESKG